MICILKNLARVSCELDMGVTLVNMLSVAFGSKDGEDADKT